MIGDYRALRAYVESRADWAGLGVESLVAALNAATTIPAPLRESVLLGGLGVTSIASLLNWPNLGLLKTDIAAGNRAGVALWLPQLVAAGKITQAEAAAVGGLLAAVEATGPALATTIEGWGLPVTAADLTSDRYGSAGN